MEYFTKWNPAPAKKTNAGDAFLATYQEKFTKDGQKKLERIGQKNINDMIQADLESTKIENILHQVAMGDLRALKQRDITYVDATTMPKSLMELQNLGIKAKSEFEQFPKEVKELFHNSCDEYVAQMGTQEFFDKMSPYVQKVKEIEAAGTMKAYNKKVAEQAKFEKDVAAAKEVNAE